MLAELAFNVTDWMAWTPGLETRAAWRRWAAGCESAPAGAISLSDSSGDSRRDSNSDTNQDSKLPMLPMMLRRRGGPLGQIAIGAALSCSAAGKARYVFSSRHGDLARTAGILGALAAGEPTSPAEFSMSVHHAFAGLLSIHTGNRLGHTAIAAGPDSFGFGFMEAVSCALEDPETPSLMVYCDALPPAEYIALGLDDTAVLPMVLAVQFGPNGAVGTCQRFAAIPVGCVESTGPKAGKDMDRVKTVVGVGSVAHDFLRFLLTDAAVAISVGERMQWRWSRDG